MGTSTTERRSGPELPGEGGAISPYGSHQAGPPRTAREVFEDHLRLRRCHAVEADIARNYAEDVVLLTGQGILRGHDGVRRAAALLHARLPCAAYEYRTVLLEGEVAFLEWAARSAAAVVEDGADSYVIRGGRILVQTIHYTVIPRRPIDPPGPEGPPPPRVRGD